MLLPNDRLPNEPNLLSACQPGTPMTNWSLWTKHLSIGALHTASMGGQLEDSACLKKHCFVVENGESPAD